MGLGFRVEGCYANDGESNRTENEKSVEPGIA